MLLELQSVVALDDVSIVKVPLICEPPIRLNCVDPAILAVILTTPATLDAVRGKPAIPLAADPLLFNTSLKRAAVTVTVEPVSTYILVDVLRSPRPREPEMDSLTKRKFTPPIEAVSLCKVLVSK